MKVKSHRATHSAPADKEVMAVRTDPLNFSEFSFPGRRPLRSMTRNRPTGPQPLDGQAQPTSDWSCSCSPGDDLGALLRAAVIGEVALPCAVQDTSRLQLFGVASWAVTS